jgi:hypothetical protein
MNEELVDLNVNNPGNKKFKLLFYILLGVFLFTIAALYNKYSSVESAITNKNYELQNRITKLNYEVEKANQQFLLKQNELKSYDQYQSLLKFVRLRDSLYNSLPFKYGDKVIVLPDSIKGVINSISINANALEYSIKYVVKVKGNNYSTYSISDLQVDPN